MKATTPPRTKRDTTRRALRAGAWLGVGWVGLVACNGLLGTDPSEGPLLPAEELDGAPADRSRADARDGGSDVEVDAEDGDAHAIVPVACGDSSGLLAGAPWPTGGACNTRVSRAAVKPLVKPKIVWRHTIPPAVGGSSSDQFMSGPAVGPDGTVYATYAQKVEGSLEYSLVAVRNSTLRFKTRFPSGHTVPLGVPTLAADGTIYAVTIQGLSAFGATGALRWSYALSTAATSSPAVLPDGTVVVAGAELVAVKPNGTKRWSLAPVGKNFVGAVAVTPSGLLAVGEAPPAGTVGQSVSIVSPEGQRRRNVPMPNSSALETTPLVTENGAIVVKTSTAVHAFDAMGTVKLFVKVPVYNVAQEFAVYAPPRFWLGAGGASSAGLTAVDLDNGGVHEAPEGERGFIAAAGDGSLVSVERRSFTAPSGDRKREVVVRGLDTNGAERWRVVLEDSSADMTPPALAADGSVVVTLGPTVYVIGD